MGYVLVRCVRCRCSVYVGAADPRASAYVCWTCGGGR